MSRETLARDIAYGLAGWLQLQLVQNLGGLPGEDSARFLVAQIINAQGDYLPAKSELPPNWEQAKRKLRIDIALRARSAGAVTWYGAVEIKWPGAAFDVGALRLMMVQDAMRVVFTTTNFLNAKFVVLGGSATAVNTLFDQAHPRAPKKEEQREAFGELFHRSLDDSVGEAAALVWKKHFPAAGERVPKAVFLDYNGKLRTTLLAKATARVGETSEEVGGYVYVWQCRKFRGSAVPP